MADGPGSGQEKSWWRGADPAPSSAWNVAEVRCAVGAKHMLEFEDLVQMREYEKYLSSFK